MKLKKYDIKFQYSYTFGAFPTIELIKNKPELRQCILIHSDLKGNDSQRRLYTLCKSKNILLKEDTLNVEKLRDKENIFVIGVFKKFKTNIYSKNNHIVLVNPSDMGNSGTIIRTDLGFGYTNFVFIKSQPENPLSKDRGMNGIQFRKSNILPKHCISVKYII